MTKKKSNNPQNLIPNSERSPEQLKAMTSKGGINSGIAKRERKKLVERYQIMLDWWTKNEAARATDPELAEMLLDVGAEVMEQFKIMSDPSVKPDVRLAAIRDMQDRQHGKPKQTVDSSVQGDVSFRWLNEGDKLDADS